MTVGTTLGRRGLLVALATAFCGLLSAVAQAGPVQRILSIVYSGSSTLDPNVENLANNLRATGAIVTDVIGPSSGDLASLLSQNTFDQIFIWDISIFPPVNDADKAALATWWSASPKNLVLDSRSAALFVHNFSTEQAFTRNIVANLASRGGGLWIGATNSPAGARTANRYLTALDPQTPLFEGSFYNVIPVVGSDNPLLTTPNLINPAGLVFNYGGGFVRTVAPTVGPGGIPLQTVIRDVDTHPLITTNIPEPPGFLGMGAGGAVLFACRRARR